MRENEENSVGFPKNSVVWVVHRDILVEGPRRRVEVWGVQVT